MNIERLLESGGDPPECRCGKEMHFAHVVSLPNKSTTHIRVYACASCDDQMRLTVWGSNETAAERPGFISTNASDAGLVT
jgi:hypothetical protein